jgi:hypothetical protein
MVAIGKGGVVVVDEILPTEGAKPDYGKYRQLLKSISRKVSGHHPFEEMGGGSDRK